MPRFYDPRDFTVIFRGHDNSLSAAGPAAEAVGLAKLEMDGAGGMLVADSDVRWRFDGYLCDWFWDDQVIRSLPTCIGDGAFK